MGGQFVRGNRGFAEITIRRVFAVKTVVLAAIAHENPQHHRTLAVRYELGIVPAVSFGSKATRTLQIAIAAQVEAGFSPEYLQSLLQIHFAGIV